MNHIEEKRETRRLAVNCEIYCKLLGTEELHEALCVTLSGNGISFVSKQAFTVGSTVEVIILLETKTKNQMTFSITIVRCQTTENGDFDMGAIIHLSD
jgi:glucose uptake protein GlcU